MAEPTAPTIEQLESQIQELSQQRNELMQQQTPLQEVEQFNDAVQEVQSVLDATSTDVGDAADKIAEYKEGLSAAHTALRDALNQEQVQQLIEGVTAGLEQASGVMEEVAGEVGQLASALETLEAALQLSEGTAAEQVDALASTLEAVVEELAPLIQRIPGLGAFFEIYAKAVSAIAGSIGSIQETQARFQRIWELLRPGTQMYPHRREAELPRAQP